MRTRRDGRTGVLFFPAFDWAIAPDHPEREERLLYTRDVIMEEGALDLEQIATYTPRQATEKEISMTHICVPDVAHQATEAHRVAVGGALTLADAWQAGEIANGFALIRPPGHHAMRVVHGIRGFCSIHNAAVLASYLRSRYGVRRIAIVDSDVHHGDGTQDIFYHDPDVLVIGLHQDGHTLYPGSGFIEELGGPGAFARNLNVPLPPGTGDEGLNYVVESLVLPVLEDFQPEVVINSAGQDNHYSDPLAMMRVSAQGYARLSRTLSADLALLEGGYAVQSALPYVNLAILLALADVDASGIREPDYDPRALRESARQWDAIRQSVEIVREIWERPDEAFGQLYPRLGTEYSREKRIHYDTDRITEDQQETVRLCEVCSGWLRIDSRARGGFGRRRIWAIVVPWGGCTRCRDEALAQYEAVVRNPKAPYDWAYVQDQAEGEFRRYAFAHRTERVM